METSAAFMAFCKVWLPSILGAFIGMVIDKPRTILMKIFVFFVGVVMSHYISGAMFEYVPNIGELLKDIIKVGAALFGMRIVIAINSQIKPFFRALRSKFAGRDPHSKRGDLK
jgi:hypothetical protein